MLQFIHNLKHDVGKNMMMMMRRWKGREWVYTCYQKWNANGRWGAVLGMRMHHVWGQVWGNWSNEDDNFCHIFGDQHSLQCHSNNLVHLWACTLSASHLHQVTTTLSSTCSYYSPSFCPCLPSDQVSSFSYASGMITKTVMQCVCFLVLSVIW